MKDVYDVEKSGDLLLSVHAQPGAGRSQVVGRHGDALKIRVAAPPTLGRANEELIGLVADVFGVKPAAVELVSGAGGRQKRFRVKGVDPDDVDRLIERALEGTATGSRRGVPDKRR
ncbi:MAG TPA: DUF167 domain-containing protein [Acidimicrobiales bacterium]|nr:DUF167 domain-containing protein [Acidimicrobiales bacterium]